MLKGSILVLLFVVFGCSQHSKKPDRDLAGLFEKQSEVFSDQSGPRNFDLGSVQNLASSRNLKLSQGRLILDNDASLESKLEIIQKAQKEIRAVYYIYSLDNSSAVLTNALIKKAAAGVKVKLLVDLITNFGNLDLFRHMEKEGKGNLTVYFYNFPTPQIRADAIYLSLPCPLVKNPGPMDCANFKAQKFAGMTKEESTAFSKILLAGMYGKNPTLLKIALSVGAGIDPANYKDGTSDEETTQQLLEFLKIVKDAYFKNDFIAKIKLSIALATYGETLNPLMNEITGRLPLRNAQDSTSKQAQEWDHLTDYTHHKLLISDSQRFQLGGRNIEDSYHMKNRVSGTGKYIFMDTDFYGTTTPGGAKDLEVAFDRILKVQGLVATFNDLEKFMGLEFLANPEALAQTTQSCLASKSTDVGSCLETQLSKSPLYQSLGQRTQKISVRLASLSSEFNQKYQKSFRDSFRKGSWTAGIDSMSAQDLEGAQIYYLENLPFQKNQQNPTRQLGAKLGLESKYSKNIHEAWYRGLESACYKSQTEKRDVEVIFNSAYVFMPSGLIYRLAKMINGGYGDCSKVKVTFLTNSFETTDLNIINIFARYQLKELFQYYSLVERQFEMTQKNVAPRKISRLFPKLEYYEYNKSHVGNGISLHTKLTLLDEDMIIGSANADTRSYFMDTNNALLIRNARQMNEEYRQYIQREISDEKVTTPMHPYFASLTMERINQENAAILQGALARWDKKGRVKEKHQQRILKEFAELGARITRDTQTILDYRRQIENTQFENQNSVSQVEKELNETANRFDDFFKLL